jgi:hypothetical protein
MQMQSESRVMTCLAEDCSWNCREECCAPAIEIGDEHPRCDTFTTGAVSPMGELAPIQDCKVSDCHFNHDMECGASGITLDVHNTHADCITYRH